MAKIKARKVAESGRTDAAGLVRVIIHLSDGEGGRIKGNVVRSFRVADSTVTAVADRVKSACFVPNDIFRLKA